jgi:putative nucleotidyltransferase with HDIG domain
VRRSASVTRQDPSQEPRAVAAGLAARLSRSAGRAMAVAIVAMVSLACAWLLTPGSYTRRLPGDEALGTPALGNFKAERDYAIVDEEATSDLRAEAAASVRPVFDHDDGAPEEAAARIEEAFALMRDAPGEGRRLSPGPRPAPPSPTAPPPGEGKGGGLASSKRAFEAKLGLELTGGAFGALAEGRFSEALEGALVTLVSQGLAGNVVEDARALDPARDRGIVVREVRAGASQGEHVITDLRLVRDLAGARGGVERSAAAIPGVTGPQRAALARMAADLIKPTLVFDPAETEARQRAASARVQPIVVRVRRGEKIVGDGEVIEKRHLIIFRGIKAQTRAQDVFLVRLGAAILVATLVLLLWRHARRNVVGFRPARKDPLLAALVLIAVAGIASAGPALGDALHDRVPLFSPEAFFYLVPFAAGATVIRCVLSAELGLLFSVASGAVVGLIAGDSLFLALHVMLTSVVASGLVARTRDRAGLFKVGAAVGALGVLLVLATHLFTGSGWVEALAPALAALLGGAVLLPVLVIGVLPIVEWAFGYLTDVKLLELANLNHPALKDLIVRAPGTYHHSVIMGSLVEAAADAIGANALLAKVCAYYHDLGKIRNPLSFAENQRGENRHDDLAPSMSALIIKRHVTDGLELARHWGLPRAVAAAIPEHHGTRLVSFFWARARQRASEGGAEGGALDEALFRYPGPKPRSRETALIMIADVCEASARALPDPSPERLRALVHKRINEIFSEGQLDECALTLKDLNAIAAAMIQALAGIYHARPEYRDPEQSLTPEPGSPPPLHLVGSMERQRP